MGRLRRRVGNEFVIVVLLHPLWLRRRSAAFVLNLGVELLRQVTVDLAWFSGVAVALLQGPVLEFMQRRCGLAFGVDPSCCGLRSCARGGAGVVPGVGGPKCGIRSRAGAGGGLAACAGGGCSRGLRHGDGGARHFVAEVVAELLQDICHVRERHADGVLQEGGVPRVRRQHVVLSHVGGVLKEGRLRARVEHVLQHHVAGELVTPVAYSAGRWA